jgi:hypothetical protein
MTKRSSSNDWKVSKTSYYLELDLRLLALRVATFITGGESMGGSPI